MLYDLESHAKDGRCGLSRNEDIRRYVGKLVEMERQTLQISSLEHLNLHQKNASGASLFYDIFPDRKDLVGYPLCLKGYEFV